MDIVRILGMVEQALRKGQMYEVRGLRNIAFQCYEEAHSLLLSAQEDFGIPSPVLMELFLPDVSTINPVIRKFWFLLGMCYLRMGELCKAEGLLSEAANYLEQSVRILQMIEPSSLLIIESLLSLGSVFLIVDRPREALEYFSIALSTAQNGSVPATVVAKCHNNVGSAHQSLGENEQALYHFEKCMEICLVADPNSLEAAVCHNNLGFMHYTNGELEKALEYFKSALKIHRKINPHSLETAEVLSNVASVYLGLGDCAKALLHYEQALEIFTRLGPISDGASIVLNGIGLVYDLVGDLEKAMHYYNKSLEIARMIAPHSRMVATRLVNIGDVYRQLGDTEAALEYFEQALAIDNSIVPNSPEVAIDLLHIASIFRQCREFAKAIEKCTKSLQITQSVDCHPSIVIGCYIEMGDIYLEMQDTTLSLHYYQCALEKSEQMNPNSFEHAICLRKVGYVHQVQQSWDTAINYLERATQVVESLRARAGNQRAKEQLFEQHQDSYRALIACLHERSRSDDHARAFHYAERSRARTLLELLAERQVEIHPKTETQAQLLEQERALQFRLAATHNRLIELRQNPHPPHWLIAQLEAEERQLEEQLERVRDAIRREFPAYAQLEYPEPLTLEEVQQQVLDADVLLLEYAVASKNEAFVWAVRQDKFVMLKLPRDGREISYLITQTVGSYHGIPVFAEEAEAARQALTETLIEVVPAEFWQGVSRVIIVPDGALYYLPFEILPLQNGQLLSEAYPILYVPSATVLHNLHQLWDRRPAPDYEGEFVGFGDPLLGDGDDEDEHRAAGRVFAQRGLNLAPLPGTRVEVENIAQRFGERVAVYLEHEATEHKAKTATRGYRYVHFATHGILDDRNPLYSGLALSPPQPTEPPDADDILQVWEMFGLKLDAEVVALSACQTGLGHLRGGEGLVGMSRALFFAGAKSLVVSLWSVPDIQTATLMQWFYEELSQGKSVVEALRAAKARMRTVEPDPLYWAAFIPMGLAW